MANDTRNACQAHTSTGAQCTFKAKPNFKYCGVHLAKFRKLNDEARNRSVVVLYKRCIVEPMLELVHDHYCIAFRVVPTLQRLLIPLSECVSSGYERYPVNPDEPDMWPLVD